MRVFRDTWLIFRRSLGLSVRNPAWLDRRRGAAVRLPAPLRAAAQQPDRPCPAFPTGGAFNTFVPGLLVMTALFGSTFVGFGFIDEMRAGVVERMRVTPMSRTAAVLGRTLRDVVIFLVQGLILVVLSIPLRADDPPARRRRRVRRCWR